MRNLNIIFIAVFILVGCAVNQKQTKNYNEINLNSIAGITFNKLRDFKLPVVNTVYLENGLTVLLVKDDELPLININVLTHAGSHYINAEKAGLTSILSQVMRTGGTQSMHYDKVNAALDNKAAKVSFSIGMDSATANLNVLTDHFDEIFNIFVDLIKKPAFPEKKIAIAKNQLYSSISRRNDNPQQVAFREFKRLIVGPNSNYGVLATFDSVASIGRKDLIQWHQRFFHPKNMIIGVSGSFEIDDMVDKIKNAFLDWPNIYQPLPQKPMYTGPVETGIYFINKENINQTNILMGHLGIQKDHPDFFAVQLLNQVVGGGFSARFTNSIRTKQGLAYNVFANIGSKWDRVGITSFGMATSAEQTIQGIKALQQEIINISKQPITHQELTHAKESLLNSFIFNYDSVNKVLGQQLLFEYYGYSPQWLEQYKKNIEQVTVKQIRTVAKNYVNLDKMVTLIVGPQQQISGDLSSLGPISEIDVSIKK